MIAEVGKIFIRNSGLIFLIFLLEKEDKLDISRYFSNDIRRFIYVSFLLLRCRSVDKLVEICISIFEYVLLRRDVKSSS